MFSQAIFQQLFRRLSGSLLSMIAYQTIVTQYQGIYLWKRCLNEWEINYLATETSFHMKTHLSSLCITNTSPTWTLSIWNCYLTVAHIAYVYSLVCLLYTRYMFTHYFENKIKITNYYSVVKSAMNGRSNHFRIKGDNKQNKNIFFSDRLSLFFSPLLSKLYF